MASIRSSAELALLAAYRANNSLPGLFVGLQRNSLLPASCTSPFYWSDGSGPYSANCSAGGYWCSTAPSSMGVLAGLAGSAACLSDFATSW